MKIGGARVKNDVRGEVKNAFERSRRHIEKKPHARGNTFEIPDVTDGSGKFNVPHAFASNFRASDFNAAAVADGAFVTNAFIFAAVTFPIASGSENTFAKETVAFGLESAIVNGFGLFNFAVRPKADFIGRGKADAHGVKNINVKHEEKASFKCRREKK